MKLPGEEKKTPTLALCERQGDPDRALREHLDSDLADPGALFFESLRKAAGFQRKDFEYGMHVSKTLVREWFDGTKHDPLTRARSLVALFRAEGKIWLIPVILQYIAGADFNGAVLTEEQARALREVAKAVEK